MNTNRKLGAIILAAGRGKRMNTRNKNKVTLTLAHKPLVKHSVDLLETLQFHTVVVVVGYAKESVKEVLKNDTHVIFAEQEEQLGTAHAVSVGFEKIPNDVTDILVIQGDDSAFYTKEIIEELAAKHIESNAAVSFLTVELENPYSLGRVVRDTTGNVIAIVEEKDATDKQRGIKEINAACYFFSTKFLNKYLKQIRKSLVTGEYYLVSLIEMASKHNETIATIQADLPWRGVNTREELEEAEQLFAQLRK
jgi:bifunctional N-acetylglucosamine-1-phosphate-uridyltransferase/glucosamine-1-phosphate-acetyltransferase GlmU-like protein